MMVQVKMMIWIDRAIIILAKIDKGKQITWLVPWPMDSTNWKLLKIIAQNFHHWKAFLYLPLMHFPTRQVFNLSIVHQEKCFRIKLVTMD